LIPSEARKRVHEPAEDGTVEEEVFAAGEKRKRKDENQRSGRRRGRRSEVGGRRSEVGGRRSEVGGRRSEVGKKKRSEIRGRRSEVGKRGKKRTAAGAQKPEAKKDCPKGLTPDL
jgi:hypothetical protein